MARLDQVITNIVDIFLEYADDEGKKRQLNKEELKKVLEQEIQSPELKVSNKTHSDYMICTFIHKEFVTPASYPPFACAFHIHHLTAQTVF